MSKQILFINACIRGKEISRTYKVANAFLDEYKKNNPDDIITELELGNIKPEYMHYDNYEENDAYIKKRDFSSPMFDLAKQFVSADKIIIAAPFWQFSFPAALTSYLENVYVAGLTFRYSPEGSIGLCKAEKLIFITTIGGDYSSPEMFEKFISLKHLKALSELAGIKNFDYISGECLDIVGYDANKIVNECIEKAIKKAKLF